LAGQFLLHQSAFSAFKGSYRCSLLNCIKLFVVTHRVRKNQKINCDLFLKHLLTVAFSVTGNKITKSQIRIKNFCPSMVYRCWPCAPVVNHRLWIPHPILARCLLKKVLSDSQISKYRGSVPVNDPVWKASVRCFILLTLVAHKTITTEPKKSIRNNTNNDPKTSVLALFLGSDNLNGKS